MIFTNADCVNKLVDYEVYWLMYDQVYWKMDWQVRNQVNNKMWGQVCNKINPIKNTISQEIGK